MGGLQPTLYIAKSARVMLTRNLWTTVGLCNGAVGTVLHIIYAEGQCPSVPLNFLNGSVGKILTPDLNLTRLLWYTVFLKMVTPLASVNSFLHETIILTITIFEIIVQTSQFQNPNRNFSKEVLNTEVLSFGTICLIRLSQLHRCMRSRGLFMLAYSIV